MNAVMQDAAQGYRYHLLRGALERFSRNLAQLDDRELDEARRRADRTWDLESLVLTSAEAREVCVPAQQVDAAFAAVQSRYPDRVAFATDLRSNGLDEDLLRAALRRELVFDSVMLRVASRRPAISPLDVRIYYELHPERFAAPEQRQARQILVTINDDFVENHREAAWSRMQRIGAALRHAPNRFAALARKYSECPSALDGGRLGPVQRGQLYPQLDTALFAMPEGAVSDIVETGLGLHLLWCEKVVPARSIPFAKAEPRIREYLDERNRRNCQKSWLKRLRQTRAQEHVDE
jgi:peptidyl-prolyl cis-trans isomerase C